MPELFLDIKLGLDSASEQTVRDRIQAIQDEANQASKGGTKATQQQTNAEQDLVRAKKEKLKALIREKNIAEANFRIGNMTQAQLEQTTREIFEQAQAQDLLSAEVDQTGAKYKQLIQAQVRANSGFKGLGQESVRANQALMNMGRIVQDLPFGFLGISNNIDPALRSFRDLKEESGSTLAALKLLGGSLMGSGGLVFALGSLLPTAFLIAQQGFNMYSRSASKAEDSTSKLTDSVRNFISESAGFRSSSSFLDIDRMQREIEAIDRLEFGMEKIRDQLKDITKANEIYARVSADVTSFQSDYKDALDEEKQVLKEIEKQYGINADQLEIIKKRQKELNDELAVAKALFKADPTAQYVQGIEKTTEQFNFLAEASVLAERRLKEQAETYRLMMQELQPLILANEDAREKYIALSDAVKDLTGQYEKITGTLPDVEFKTDLVARAEGRLAESMKKSNKERERRRKFEIQQRQLLGNLPSQPGEDFTGESRALAQQALIQQMQSDRQISAAQGLAQKKLEIERWYWDQVMSLGKQGLLNDEILNQLRLTKEQKLALAELEIVRSTEEEKRKIREQATRQAFAVANNFISSLMQLNQAQSDETERQARKRFETQKKLSIAQAIVSGAAAVVETYKSMGGFPTALPFVAGQIAATAAQIAAIKRTEFNSGSSSSSGSEAQRGFFESSPEEFGMDTTQGDPMRPSAGNNMKVEIGFTDGADEMFSIKTENGDRKRRQATITTV